MSDGGDCTYGCQTFGVNTLMGSWGQGGADGNTGDNGFTGASRAIKSALLVHLNFGETFPIGSGGAGGGGGNNSSASVYGGYGGYGGGAILIQSGSINIDANLVLASPGYSATTLNGSTSGVAGGGGGGGGGGGSAIVLYRSLSGAGSLSLSADGQAGGNGGGTSCSGGDGGDGGDGVTLARRV